MDGKDKEVNITEVPEWNRLSLDEYNTEFFEEFNKIRVTTSHNPRMITIPNKHLKCLTHT